MKFLANGKKNVNAKGNVHASENQMLMEREYGLEWEYEFKSNYRAVIRELKQRRRRRQRERQKSETTTLHVHHLFCTFLCRRCTTTTSKCVISRFVEGGSTRQQLSFSFPEL